MVNEQRQAIDEKNARICALETERNDAEWKLGEHRQWLADAHNRLGLKLAFLFKAFDDHTEWNKGFESLSNYFQWFKTSDLSYRA